MKKKYSFIYPKYEEQNNYYSYAVGKKLVNANIGDYTQIIAAINIIKKYSNIDPINLHLDRDNLKYKKSGFKKVGLITNGWFSHSKSPFDNIGTLKNLDILPISIHAQRKSTLTAEAIKYLNKFPFVGARDKGTEKWMKELGVKNPYFSACLTLTLEKESFDTYTERDKHIILNIDNYGENSVWVNTYEELKNTNSFVTNKVLETIETYSNIDIKNEKILNINQRMKFSSFQKGMELAEQRIKEILESKLVITTRIHMALPALALGVPVLYISKNKYDVRMDGIQDLFNRIEFTDKENPEIIMLTSKLEENPQDYLQYREQLNKTVKEWIEKE